MTRRVGHGIACVLLGMLAGCAGTPRAETGETMLAFDTGMWVLAAYGPATAAEPVLPGATVTLTIDRDAGRVSGVAGCNQYTGSFTEQGGKLQMGPLAMTKRFCPAPDGLMALESTYAEALAGATHAERNGGQLQVFYDDNRALVFVSGASGA